MRRPVFDADAGRDHLVILPQRAVEKDERRPAQACRQTS